jgi:hypothetical protein
MSKKESKPVVQKERKPVAPLTGAALEEQRAILIAAENVVAKIKLSTSLTPTYLWRTKSQVTRSIIEAIKAKRPSKRARLEARIAKLQAEVVALKD